MLADFSAPEPARHHSRPPPLSVADYDRLFESTYSTAKEDLHDSRRSRKVTTIFALALAAGTFMLFAWAALSVIPPPGGYSLTHIAIAGAKTGAFIFVLYVLDRILVFWREQVAHISHLLERIYAADIIMATIIGAQGNENLLRPIMEKLASQEPYPKAKATDLSEFVRTKLAKERIGAGLASVVGALKKTGTTGA